MTNNEPARNGMVLDLGTNTFRWLIGSLEDGQEKARGRSSIRIGRSLSTANRFEQPELDLAVSTLSGWKQQSAADFGNCRYLGIATHAFRAASNGTDAARVLSGKSGIPIEIVSPEREAGLTFRGCTADDLSGEVCILDIGGGSTELSWGRQGKVAGSFSLPIGVVTLAAAATETLSQSILKAEKAVDRACQQVYNMSPSEMFQMAKNTQLFSTCGTSSALTMEFVGLPDYDRSGLHGKRVPKSWLDTLIQQRCDWTPANWAEHAHGSLERATLMGPGMGILHTFLNFLEIPDWLNSEAGLLEGIWQEMHTTRKEESTC